MFVMENFGERKPGDPHDSLIGLFDGHGGRGTVDFVAAALPQNLARIMKNKAAQKDVTRALRAAFLLTDMQSDRFVSDSSGSTGVCCLLRCVNEGLQKRTQIFVANCGDSRAVLATEGGKRGLRLTRDHKGEDGVEQQRISTAAGFTHSGRTLGVLAVSRSFCDRAFKVGKGPVRSGPHTTTTCLIGTQHASN